MKFFRGLMFVTIMMFLQGYSAVSHAEVINRTGDYRLVTSESDVSPLLDSLIARYYHSTWMESGMFGKGWMTDLDLKVTREADGTLIIADLCNGDQLSYAKSDKLAVKTTDNVAAGSAYTNDRCGCSSITEVPGGFTRITRDRTENFGSDGVMTSVTKGKSGRVDIRRDGHGRVIELRAATGQNLEFTYDENSGAVASIRSGNHQNVLQYRYDNDGRLSSVVKNGEELHTYEYTEERLSHYTSSEIEEWISYFNDDIPKVKSIRNVRGDFFTYEYRIHSDDGLEYSSIETRIESDESVSIRESRYTEHRGVNGKSWLKHLAEYSDGELSRETTYAPTSLPLLVSSPDSTVTYSYDEQGRIISTDSADRSIKFEYDKNTGKTSLVKKIEHPEEIVTTTSYFYDDNGRLARVEDSSGHNAVLEYNSLEQIEKMIEGGQVLTFGYNPLGKPDHIELQGEGIIDVTYDSQGTITSVHSDKGSVVSLKIISMFTSLLKMVHQAEVKY